jgi:peptide/nickel transport system substrate-binding protein
LHRRNEAQDSQTTTETTETTESNGESSDGENVLRLINASMSTLDPVKASDTASSEVTTQIYDGLLTWPDGAIPVETLIAKG